MKYFFGVFLSVLVFTVKGKSNYQDSTIVQKVDSLTQVAPEKALLLAEEYLAQTLNSGDTLLHAKLLHQAGDLNRKKGNFDKAISQLKSCINYQEGRVDLQDLAITHNTLGKAYFQKGLYENAVEQFFAALKLAELDKNLLGQSYYINNVAAAFDMQHNYAKALEYYNRSLKIKQQLGDQKGIAASYTNIAISQYNLGELNLSTEYQKKGYAIYKELNDTTKFVRCLNNLSRCLIDLKRLNEAEQRLAEALSYSSSIFNQKLLMELTLNTALVKFRLNKREESKSYLNQVMAMAKESNAFELLHSAYNLSAEVAAQEGEHKKGYELLTISHLYQDSLITETNLYAANEMAAKYEHEKNKRLVAESELQVANKDKELQQNKLQVLYWTIASIILVVLFVIFVILYFSKQRNQQLLKGQLALIDKQNKGLTGLNEKLKKELDSTQISLEEKEELLSNVFSKSKEIELPEEILALSKREMEVLSHLALGWTDDQLAEKLFISKSTVKTHLRRIYSKLLVRGRAEAVAIAHKYDLLGQG